MQSAKVALIFVTYVTTQRHSKMHEQDQRLKQQEKLLVQERHFQGMTELSLTIRSHNIILIIRFTMVVGSKTTSILTLATYFVIHWNLLSPLI